MKAARWDAQPQHIHNLRLFNNVALSNIDQLLHEFLAFDIDAGEILLSPTTRNQYLYVLIEGQMQVYLGSLDNQPISTLAVGDCAGEISFIDDDHPSAYVVASQDSRVLRLHRTSLVNLFQQSPQLMQNLLELLCDRVRQGNRSILNSEQHANIDTLTGAFNRRWLEHIYERESTRCAFNEQPLSLLMLDVDHFKDYNDHYGHVAGDYALCMVAHTLSEQLRTKDSLIRYGGEEFVVLLPETDTTEAQRIGERLRSSLHAKESFYCPCGPLPGVTVSIGLTSMIAKDSLQKMISRADCALYRAKQQGRNCLRR